MADKFAERITDLENLLASTEKSVAAKDRCMPTMVIAGLATPLVLLLLLFFIQPRFVTRKEGKRKIRDGKKIALYTAIGTVLVWAVMYFYSKSQGMGSGSMTCQR